LLPLVLRLAQPTGLHLGRRSPLDRLSQLTTSRFGLTPEPIGGQPLLIRSGIRPVRALNVYVGSSFGGFRELFGAIGALNVRFGAGFGGISPLVCMIGTDFGGIRAPVRRVRPLARVCKLRHGAIGQGEGGVGPPVRLGQGNGEGRGTVPGIVPVTLITLVLGYIARHRRGPCGRHKG
jgi:hypothetical protein